MNSWSVNKAEGTATGPAEELTAGGVSVRVDTYWSDEDGVCLEVTSRGDVIPAALAVELAAVIARLAATPAPEFSAI